jgi:hypothetical protein
MTTAAFQLVDDAYVCLADNRLVFSDVRHDRYRCLDRRNTQAALRLFPDFPGLCDAQTPEDLADDQERARLVGGALLQAGLLADKEIGGKPFVPISIPAPTRSIASDRPVWTAQPTLGNWMSFLQAAFGASGKLRFQSLRRIVRRVENRKRQHIGPNSEDRDTLDDLVAIFHRLRPYYVREYLCRFDSLALVDFLARYGLFPSWVFGVTSEPFAAHCWVQDGNVVLNDSIDYVERFTPVMAF